MFLQQLRLLEGFDLAAMGHASADYVHTVTECAKLAFADREAWYGDPDFVDVPMDMLLSRDVRRRATALSSGDESSADVRFPAATTRACPSPVAAVAAGARRRRADARRHGAPRRRRPLGEHGVGHAERRLAVGAPVIPELGFCLGTRAQMFWLEEGLPNSLEPGKRPRTTLSPTLVAREGEPVMALGTPGGDQQDQWTLHVFLAHVALRHGPAGRDRRAEPSHRGVPELVLSARDGAAARRRRVPRGPRDDRRACGRAATTSRGRRPGRSAA